MSEEQKTARLLEAWLDGGLAEGEKQGLLEDLDQDPSLRSAIASQLAMLGALNAAQTPDPRWLALFDLLESSDSANDERDALEEQTMARISKMTEIPWHRRFPFLQAAAAILIIALGWTLFIKREPAKTITSTPPEDPGFSEPIAIVLGSEFGSSDLEIGEYLGAGNVTQSKGWLSLQTLKGVSITLEAPFDINLVSHDEVQIQQGNVRVLVPPGAEGFQLLSSVFKIIDLGTQFAAEVQPDGSGRCRVFEGIADVSVLDSLGVATQTRRLSANKSARVKPDSGRVEIIKEDDSSYPEIRVLPRPVLHLTETYPSQVKKLKPDNYWRFESIDDGLVHDEMSSLQTLAAKGSATIGTELGGNHSGVLTQANGASLFQTHSIPQALLNHNFSISFYAQFAWLQNFTMISLERYTSSVKGHAMVLQAFAAFRKSGLSGTGLHAAFRDPPGWTGGTEIYGSTLLRPNFWHHIAMVRESGTVTLFLDGKEVGSKHIGNMNLDFKNLFVGRMNANFKQHPESARGMVGRIDEIAIFPRALSPEEIEILASGQITEKSDD